MIDLNDFGEAGRQTIASAIHSGLANPNLKISHCRDRSTFFETLNSGKSAPETLGGPDIIQNALKENRKDLPLDESKKNALRQVLAMIKDDPFYDFEEYQRQLNKLLPE